MKSGWHMFVFARNQGLHFPHPWRQVYPVNGIDKELPFNAFVYTQKLQCACRVICLECSATFFLRACYDTLALAIHTFFIFGKSQATICQRGTIGPMLIGLAFLSSLTRIRVYRRVQYRTAQRFLDLTESNYDALVLLKLIVLSSVVYRTHKRYIFIT